MKKLYVGGLPFATGDQELNDLFAAHGKVNSAKIITDKFSGRSRGFGFVEMENDNEAQSAIEKMNNSEYSGRRLTVNEARPMTDRPKTGFGGGRREGGFKKNFNRW
ncbi:MAG: RNA-binding protein [Elusimicrobiota bacterium]